MNAARRILLLVTDLEIGGTPTVVRELATRLRDGRTHVEVACLKGEGPNVALLRERGVAVTTLGARTVFDLPRVARAVRRLIRSSDIGTVASFLVHANVIAALASRALPNVRWLQSIQTVQPYPKWHWRAQRWAAQRAEKLFGPSHAIAAAASERSGVATEKFVVIPNAVDPDDYTPGPVFTGPKVRVGVVGRLDHVKRPAALLPAVELLRDEIELHVFGGTGPDAENFVEEVRRLDLTRDVSIHPFAADPREPYKRIDVLWSASDVEGFGLVLIEAMAGGVPVVAVRAGGTAEVLEHEMNSLVIGAEIDPHEVARATRRLRDDVALRERLIGEGQRTVDERFSWSRVIEQYRTFFDTHA